jgi:hypothetical protein
LEILNDITDSNDDLLRLIDGNNFNQDLITTAETIITEFDKVGIQQLEELENSINNYSLYINYNKATELNNLVKVCESEEAFQKASYLNDFDRNLNKKGSEGSSMISVNSTNKINEEGINTNYTNTMVSDESELNRDMFNQFNNINMNNNNSFTHLLDENPIQFITSIIK